MQLSSLGIPAMPQVGTVPPPPPPAENDNAFVRRVRLTYMGRAAQAHERSMMQDDDDLGTTTPRLVFSFSLLLPYLGSIISIACFTSFVVFFALKFGRVAEKLWYRATAIGIGMVVLVLEVVRSTIKTVVELRRYEVRRQTAAGDFLNSRLRTAADAEDDKAAPAPARPKRVPRKPPVPVAPPAPKYGPPDGHPRALTPGVPTMTAGGAELPLGPPPPAPGTVLPSLKLQGKGVLGDTTPQSAATPVGSARTPLMSGRFDGATPPASGRTPPGGGMMLPPPPPGRAELERKLREGRRADAPPPGTPSSQASGMSGPPKPPTPPPPWAARRAPNPRASYASARPS